MGIQINQLTATTPGASQSLPVYDPAKGDSRRFSLSDLLTWIQANTVAGMLEANTQYSAPLAGGNVLVNDDDEDTHLIITPAGGLATLTITLPAMGSLRDKQKFICNCTQAIAALTIAGNGATVGVVATLLLDAADDYFTLKYDATLNIWYRIG
jgi:hypothetical protein